MTLPVLMSLASFTLVKGATDAPGATLTVMPQRYTVTQHGNIVLGGNTSMTCVEALSYSAQACTDARNGTSGTYAGITNINDHLFMGMVDIDGDGSTFNSSSSNVNIPSGATITFAGLYWGGNTAAGVGGAAGDETQQLAVKLKGPSGGYISIGGTLLAPAILTTTGNSRVYAAFANVTNFVSGLGTGTYTVGNVQAGTGVRDDAGQSGGIFGGWSLIIVYKNPAEPLRNMSVWDALFRVEPNTSGTASLSNFITPSTGQVQAAIAVFVMEGDLGLTGDSLQLNGSNVSNALNPTNNIFNGTVSDFGNQIGRNPQYTNQLGVDVDVIDASGKVSNGATSATITLPTSGDNYFPAMIAMAIDVFAPDVQITKTARDVNGGLLNPGDLVQYTIVLNNTGPDTALRNVITDKIPPNTTYFPGSLENVSQPCGIAGATFCTDQPGDDTAEFDSGNNQVVFRVGSNANTTTGGSIANGESVTVRFCVRVNAGTADNTSVLNTANDHYVGATLQDNHDITATATVLVQTHDVSVIKTDGGVSVAPGSILVYTITAVNASSVTNANNAVLTETLPANTTFVGPASWLQVGSTNQYVNHIGTLTPNQSISVQFIVLAGNNIPSGVLQLNNIVSVGDDGSTGPDNNLTNNTFTEVTPLVFADLSITKDDGKTGLREGDTTIYTIVVSNNGPGNVTGARVRDPLAHGVLSQSWTCTASAGASCSAPSGSGAMDTLVNLNAGSKVTFLLTAVTGPCDGLLINTATVDSPVADPNPSNNTATDIDGLGTGANLMIKKTSPSRIAVAGSPIAYTIMVTNYGPDAASAVTATDNLPAQLTYVSNTTSQGAYDMSTGVWKIGGLAVGASAKMVLTATVGSLPNGTLIINTATAQSAPQGNGGLLSDQRQVTVGKIFVSFLPALRK